MTARDAPYGGRCGFHGFVGDAYMRPAPFPFVRGRFPNRPYNRNARRAAKGQPRRPFDLVGNNIETAARVSPPPRAAAKPVIPAKAGIQNRGARRRTGRSRSIHARVHGFVGAVREPPVFFDDTARPPGDCPFGRRGRVVPERSLRDIRTAAGREYARRTTTGGCVPPRRTKSPRAAARRARGTGRKNAPPTGGGDFDFA